MQEESSGYETRVYASFADGSMFADLPRGELLERLYLAILLDGVVVVPDVFFFISPQLASLACGDRENIVSVGLGRGVIVPYMRHPVTSFAESLSSLRDARIRGVLPDASKVAAALDNAIDITQINSLRWKPRMGVSFRDLALTTLARPAFPACLDKDIPRGDAWQVSAPWRMRLSEIASVSPEDGLRRGAVLQYVAEAVGHPKWERVESPTSILRFLNSRRRSQEADAFLLFYKWLSDVYHLAHASSQQCQHVFLPERGGAPIVPYLVAKHGGDAVLRGGEIGRSDGYPTTIEVVVRLPTRRALESISPRALLSAISESRREFLEARVSWSRQSDNVVAQNRLREAALTYSEAVGRKVGHRSTVSAAESYIDLALGGLTGLVTLAAYMASGRLEAAMQAEAAALGLITAVACGERWIRRAVGGRLRTHSAVVRPPGPSVWTSCQATAEDLEM